MVLTAGLGIFRRLIAEAPRMEYNSNCIVCDQTFIDNSNSPVERVGSHVRVGFPERERVDGVAAIEPLRFFNVVQMDVPTVAHHPFARGYVEISGNLPQRYVLRSKVGVAVGSRWRSKENWQQAQKNRCRNYIFSNTFIGGTHDVIIAMLHSSSTLRTG